MGRKSKTKGAVGERELAGELTRLFGVEAHRGRQYHGGPGTPDVVADLPGIHIECKRAEWMSLYAALDQAAADAGDAVPLVCHRKNARPWVVIAKLDDLPRLAGLLYLTLAQNA